MLSRFTQKARSLFTFGNTKERDALVFEPQSYQAGSWQWLVSSEIKYGGYISRVKRRKVSPLDHRSIEEIATGGMIGGDRMFVHGYSPYYSKHLSRFLMNDEVTLVEVGILRATGLAIWCDLFQNSRIVGLDIDLSHASNNMRALKSKGAFSRIIPELYEFDQLNPDQALLKRVFGSKKIDIVVDDGLHSHDSIITTYEAIKPYLSENYLYFIEDNGSIADSISKITGESVHSYGELTVIDAALKHWLEPIALK